MMYLEITTTKTLYPINMAPTSSKFESGKNIWEI